MLAHLKNSESGRNNYEFVDDARFRVTFIPPSGVLNSPLLTEQCIQCTGWKFPTPDTIQQSFAQSKRNYASPIVDITQELELTFELNLNKAKENFVYNTIGDWKRKVFNPATGEYGLKADYVGTLIIESYMADGEVYWTRTLKNCFPKNDLSSFGQNDVNNGEASKLTQTFIADYYEEDTYSSTN